MQFVYLHYFVPLRWDIKWNKNGHMSTKIIHPTQVSFPLNRAHIIALLYILCFRKNEEACGSGKQCLFLIGKLENKIVNTKTVKTNSPYTSSFPILNPFLSVLQREIKKIQRFVLC